MITPQKENSTRVYKAKPVHRKEIAQNNAALRGCLLISWPAPGKKRLNRAAPMDLAQGRFSAGNAEGVDTGGE